MVRDPLAGRGATVGLRVTTVWAPSGGVGEARDHAAFAELFQHLAPRVNRLLLHRGMNWALAEELTQETMLSVWRHAAAFDRTKATASTWVLTIARHKQIDQIRALSRLKEAAWEPPEPNCQRLPPTVSRPGI